MSAFPTDIGLPADVGHSDDGEALPLRARIFIFIAGAVAIGLALPLLGRLSNTHGWTTFLVLGAAAAFAQLFVVRTPRDQSYHTTIVFLVPAAMLLPPALVVLMGIV